MTSSVYLMRNPWIIAFIIPILTFAYGYFTISIIITSFILVSSGFLFLTLSKHKVQVRQTLELEYDHKHLISEHKISNQIEDEIKKGYLDTGLPESCSESEIIDQFSSTSEEESDFDCWQFSGEVCRSTDCSDGSISDEDSLIEIALQSGHYVGSKEEEEKETKWCGQQKSPELSPGSFFWWSEMNEEENLIEIDLSVGSIKCSRFEIKA